MGARRYLKTLIAAVFAVPLIVIQPAFAGDSACKDLSTVMASDLLALPELRNENNCSFPSLGISCTSEVPGASPKECQHRATITQDRMLGDVRRLIVVHSTIPSPASASDDVFVFGCVAGQLKAVLDVGCRSNAKVEHAAPDKVVVTISGRSTYKGPKEQHPQSRSFHWDAEEQRYCTDGFSCVNDPYRYSVQPNVSDEIACRRLRTIKPDALTGTPTGGCDTVDEDGDCEAEQPKIQKDRSIGDERRLIVVHGCSADHCWDDVFVYGCVAGRVRMVFNNEFLDMTIKDASPAKLVLSVGWQSDNGPTLYSTSMTNLMTYVWNAALQNYTLSSMHFSPLPED
jgi:hypothetical protein